MNSGKIQFDWKTEGTAFVHQTQRFSKLFEPEINNIPFWQIIAPPERVLAFAKGLTACLKEEDVKSYIQRDREAARGCLIVADDLACTTDKERAVFLVESHLEQTPFLTLAKLVIARCQLAIERYGNYWTRNSDSPKHRIIDHTNEV
jgi:hypothetical protein